MRLTEIIKEKENQNKHYNVIINGVTSKFWESLIEMDSNPILSESTISNNTKSLEKMLIQTSMFLPDDQREKFFETLLHPKDSILEEGFKDVASKVGNAALTVAKKVEAGKKAAAGAVVGTVVKGAKKVKDMGDEIFNKFEKHFPTVVKFGKEIIAKVKKLVGIMHKKSKIFLTMIGEKLMDLGKKDPCSRTSSPSEETTAESINDLRSFKE